jgi:hypothetical protein
VLVLKTWKLPCQEISTIWLFSIRCKIGDTLCEISKWEGLPWKDIFKDKAMRVWEDTGRKGLSIR